MTGRQEHGTAQASEPLRHGVWSMRSSHREAARGAQQWMVLRADTLAAS